MKAKVMTAHTIQELEAQINDFLGENPRAQVCFVAQSESDASVHGWSVTCTVLYRTV